MSATWAVGYYNDEYGEFWVVTDGQREFFCYDSGDVARWLADTLNSMEDEE